MKPVDFTLVWSSNDSQEEEKCNKSERGYCWLPQPPEGYRSIGFVVTNRPAKPELNVVRCVRADHTDTCESHKVIVTAVSESLGVPLFIWRTRPSDRGLWGQRCLCRYLISSAELVLYLEKISVSVSLVWKTLIWVYTPCQMLIRFKLWFNTMALH